MPRWFESTVNARAALAGNPSDGYGGRVVSTVIPTLAATVRVGLTDTTSIGDQEFENHAALLGADLDDGSPVREHAGLFIATLRVLLADHRVEPCTIEWETSIPRSVGLAGSSALVLACMRAVAQANGINLAEQDLPQLAQRVEADELAIACGLQDRVVQTFGSTLSMTFPSARDYTYFAVEPARSFALFVLWDSNASEPSQRVHGDLRERYDRGDPLVKASMARLADFARDATSALAAGDHGSLGGAMNASYLRRAMICDLAPAHVRLIEIANAAGCSANYTGSGGAVVGLFATDPAEAAAQRTEIDNAVDEFGLGLTTWSIEP